MRDPGTAPPLQKNTSIKAYKSQIKSLNTELKERFEAGDNIRDLVTLRSDRIDILLSSIWTSYSWGD
ncbi:MAG: UTP:GlnB (protein PII) uridylyltransferase, partial [Zhongshania sp.]